MSLKGEKTEQTQKAGDNSTQTQIINNYYGVSPSKDVDTAISVYKQMNTLALQNYADIAYNLANQRVDAFGKTLFPRLEKIGGALEHFKDPKFQLLTKEAQISAIRSNRGEDLKMLTELLACHIEKGDNKKISAGITRAIRIVDEVDFDSLCALTVIYSILRLYPIVKDIRTGLTSMNSLCSSLLFTSLPKKSEWIDHLNILGAINLGTGTFNKFNRIISDRWEGFACAGIPTNSEKYQKAVAFLREKGFNENELVDNECMPGYKRLRAIRKERLPNQLHPILDLYDKDKKALQEASDNFIKLWDSYDKLKEVHLWFDDIPVYFTINGVGNALAQTNGKRCFADFPDLLQ